MLTPFMSDIGNNLPALPFSKEWLPEAMRAHADRVKHLEETKRAAADKDIADFHRLPCIKREPSEFHEGHAWLGRETFSDPVDCDNDPASCGWSSPVTVKKEPGVFDRLKRSITDVIDLESPSPAKVTKKNASEENIVRNPQWSDQQHESQDTFPRVGAKPDDDEVEF